MNPTGESHAVAPPVAGHGRPATRPELLGQLLEALGPGPGVRILDLGGGSGERSDAFVDAGAEVIVVDPDPSSIVFGRTQHPRVTFVEGRAERLPLPAARFERVMAVLSFHHFEDQPTAAREVFRTLSPGGLFGIVEMRPRSLRALLFRCVHRLTGGGRLRFLDPEHLAALLANAGFARESLSSSGPDFLLIVRRP